MVTFKCWQLKQMITNIPFIEPDIITIMTVVKLRAVKTLFNEVDSFTPIDKRTEKKTKEMYENKRMFHF